MRRPSGKKIAFTPAALRGLLRGSLLLRFSILSLAALALIAAALAWILQQQLENNALSQQADEVAVVLDGTMNRHLKATDLSVSGGKSWLKHWQWLAGTLLMADQHLVRVKVWDPSGRVVYSNDPRQIGKRFPVDSHLRAALSGRRAMDVSNLSQTENALDRQRYGSLLETYVPIRFGGKVIGSYEAYSDLTGVNAQMNSARQTIWLSVGLGFLLLYASLFAIVRGASRRLIRQMQSIARLVVQAREAETLRQVDRLKDEFIGSVSHELRRPLASIKGYTGSLLLPEAEWNHEVQREFLEVVDEEADHLALLIDNLLDVARLGTGSLPLVREPVHLPAITEQIVRRIRTQSHLPSHPYHVQFPPKFPLVDADPDRISQLLLNLLENAAKYAPARTPISIAGSVEGDFVVVSVVDHGPGLSPTQALHVFDKFFRVDSGPTRATEGTGLGLAICRGVVEAHGGQIDVTSTPGQGCTFTFRLPALRLDGPVDTAALPAADAAKLTLAYPGEQR